MKQSKDYFAEFKTELSANIQKQIRVLRRDGIVGMSERNLLQVTQTPRNAHGPMGTNAQWVYAQMFHQVVTALPRSYRVFVSM